MQTFAYTRKSRALGDPDDDPAILGHQRDALLRLAAQLGLPAPTLIEEVGSGERLEDRVRLAAQIDEWERRKASGRVLMTTAVERITRGDMLEAGLIARRLQKAGVVIQTLSQRFDLSKPDDMLLFSMLAVVGHHGLARYRHDVMLRKDKLTRDGELPTGAAPYGYRWVKGQGKERGHLEPVPEQFALVQWLFDNALHMSLVRLAKATGLPRATVYYILHNPVYTGWPHRHSRSHRTAAGKTSSRLLRPSEWAVRAEKRGRYVPAVSWDQYQAVQAALSLRYCERAKTAEADGWCRRLLVLEGWDARVQLGAEGQSRTPVYNFVCRQTGRRTCYPRLPIHQAAEAKILTVLSNPHALKAALRQYEQSQSQTPDREKLEADLARLREQLVRLKIEATLEDPEDRLANHTAQEQVKSEIRAVQGSLAQTLSSGGTGRFSAALAPFVGLAAADVWAEASPVERAVIAQTLLSRIVVRITPTTWRRPVEREIVAVEVAGWYRPFQSVE